MSELAVAAGGAVATTPIRILVYSDDRGVRERVLVAVGPKVNGREATWTQVATPDAVISAVEAGGLDLLILDGEAAKYGGMGLCRQLKHEILRCPPVLLLVGRPDDAWLSTWSEAEAAVAHPLDPWELKSAVDEFFPAAPADGDE